jgi:hypothetical protein
MIVPIAKTPSEVTKQTGRPNISLRAAVKGIVTAQLRRYEVPTQNA